MKVRRLHYKKPAIKDLIILKKLGRNQDIQRIRTRCLALQAGAETQFDVLKNKTDPPVYSAFIGGVIPDELEPDQRYEILFSFTPKNIFILRILPLLRPAY